MNLVLLFIKLILLFKFKGFSGLTVNCIKSSLGQRLLFYPLTYLWSRDDSDRGKSKQDEENGERSISGERDREAIQGDFNALP